MTRRLARIQMLLVTLTMLFAVGALCSGTIPPFGIVLGGSAAWLDFVVIRGLAAVMLARRPASKHVVPLAFLKSIALLAVPAAALLLPKSVVDGVSFALGVTTLPAAIVLEALVPWGRIPVGREA